MSDLLTETVRRNCQISDARDNGLYSLCTMILKLRNLYKWEHHLEPWDEPEPPVLLDWIDAREKHWATIAGEEYQPLPLAGRHLDPQDQETVNANLAGTDLVYGAGYGRSLKAIFFLAHLREERQVAGTRVLILDREEAREMAAPFAMLQDGVIIIRRQPLRFFFWDQVQEIRSSGRAVLRHALKVSAVKVEERVDRDSFREKLDEIVDREIPAFIHHELGELQERELTSGHLRKLVAAFPHSAIELTARSVKDVLADTGPAGMLGYIIDSEMESSLAFYAAFLDGMRQVLQPEVETAIRTFLTDQDWSKVETARQDSRTANLLRAKVLREAAEALDHEEPNRVKCRIEQEVLKPLNL